MTTKSHGGVAFIAKLLAPIPAHEEQAGTRRFLLDLRADMKKVWFGNTDLLILSRAEYAYRSLSHSDGGGAAAWAKFVSLLSRQMLKPAHGRGELKWKLTKRKVDGGRPEWDAAIARDEAWIARLDAAGIFTRRAAA
tara:strand:- start:11310 stop:11720 length:411 start_codon:yes stop_codon:yes gene_type:complete